MKRQDEIDEKYDALLDELVSTGMKVVADIEFTTNVKYTANQFIIDLPEPKLKKETVVEKKKKKKSKHTGKSLL